MPDLPHRWCLTPLGQQTAAKNLGIAYLAARRHPGRGLTFEEKLSAAFMGLCNAVACFNPNRGIKLSTYAYWCAYDGIRQASRRNNVLGIPVKMAPGNRYWAAAQHALEVRRLDSDLLADLIAVEDPPPHDPDPRLARVSALVERLPPRERRIVLARSYDETFDVIAKREHVSKQRIQQIEVAAYKRMRLMLEADV